MNSANIFFVVGGGAEFPLRPVLYLGPLCLSHDPLPGGPTGPLTQSVASNILDGALLVVCSASYSTSGLVASLSKPSLGHFRWAWDITVWLSRFPTTAHLSL